MFLFPGSYLLIFALTLTSGLKVKVCQMYEGDLIEHVRNQFT